MLEFLSKLFDTSDFPARWHCGQWSSFHGWLHIVSDAAVFAAYLAIPVVLAYFVKRRRDVPFTYVYLLFGGFILACGIGHLLEAVIFWMPIYRVAGVVKLCTAVVSWGTVLALIVVFPKVLRFPSLAAVNDDLEKEISQRRYAEEELLQQARALKELNEELERYNRTMLGREERVIELKSEVNALLAESGRATRYSELEGTP